MELIDKAAVVAEIERRKHKLLDHIICESDKEWVVRTAHQLNRIILFLDDLEVKEVDLKKELIKWHKEHFKKDGTFIGMSGFYLTNNSQMDIAKHFFELGLKASQKGEKV